MGRSISNQQYDREQTKLKSIKSIDRRFNKFGYDYLPMYPNLLGNKPWLSTSKPPQTAIMELGIREAKRLLDRLEMMSVADAKTVLAKITSKKR